YLATKHINAFDFIQHNEKIINSNNLLIIGGYLYQHTGDISYLTRGLNLTDLGRSSIVYAQASRPKTSNRTASSQNVENRWINEIRALSLEFSDFDELIQLSRAYEEYLNNERSNIFIDFNDLALDQPLLDIQQEMNDSTGLLYLLEQKNGINSMLFLEDSIHYNSAYSKLDNIIQEIDNLVALSSKTNLSEDEESELVALSRVIYQELIGPFGHLLPPNLEIITGGSLDGVPFGLLRIDSSGNNPVYFGDRYRINYSYSLRTRKALRRRENNPSRQQMLAMAPAFHGPVLMSSRSGDSTRQAGSLANNRDEVAFLENQFPGAFFYDATATLSEFSRQAEDYSVIHLATHAEANARNGNRSRIYFTDTEDDNLLYAFQLPDFNLNAELVTLSACETGTGGREMFQGRVGLSQAFLAAGAKSVLSTRWAVDDRATAEIMADFYTQLKEGVAKDQALRYAQRAYRERHQGTEKASPYYWAAFDLIGDPSPIEFKSDWHYDWWKWAAGCFIAFLIIAQLSRRRAA
ncbi:MAG: CHAT domain-containing protein, partial [Bacteroidota bacterium]